MSRTQLVVLCSKGFVLCFEVGIAFRQGRGRAEECRRCGSSVLDFALGWGCGGLGTSEDDRIGWTRLEGFPWSALGQRDQKPGGDSRYNLCLDGRFLLDELRSESIILHDHLVDALISLLQSP